jgi:hypothetical protein
MGCDIHTFREYSNVRPTFKDPKWICYDHWVTADDREEEHDPIQMDVVRPHDLPGRNYDAFALLACVRGEYDYSLDPRGMPENASEIVLAEYESWGGDAHTPSYVTEGELLELLIRMNLRPPHEAMPRQKRYINELLSYMESDRVQVQQSQKRIVFWFDN